MSEIFKRFQGQKVGGVIGRVVGVITEPGSICARCGFW